MGRMECEHVYIHVDTQQWMNSQCRDMILCKYQFVLSGNSYNSRITREMKPLQIYRHNMT